MEINQESQYIFTDCEKQLIIFAMPVTLQMYANKVCHFVSKHIVSSLIKISSHPFSFLLPSFITLTSERGFFPKQQLDRRITEPHERKKTAGFQNLSANSFLSNPYSGLLSVH